MFGSNGWVATVIVLFLGVLALVALAAVAVLLARTSADRARARRLWSEPGLAKAEYAGSGSLEDPHGAPANAPHSALGRDAWKDTFGGGGGGGDAMPGG